MISVCEYVCVHVYLLPFKVCVFDVVSPITGNKTLLSYNHIWNELIRHYTECRYVVDEQWAKGARDRAKQVARKPPPPPPSKRDRSAPGVQGDKMAEMLSELLKAFDKFVKESLQKKPQMLQKLRKQQASTAS